MATISFNIPDTLLPTVIDAICFRYEYDMFKKAAETKAAFTTRMIVQNIKQIVADAESDRRKMAALDTIKTDVEVLNIDAIA